MSVRTRFAPSPTGYLHVGGVRTALFAWLVAKQGKGQFVLRLEDTDKKREVKGADAHLMESLKALGIDYDEGPDVGGKYGPYRQSERLASYKKWANKLIESGRAYADPYTPEEVQNFREQAQKVKQPFLYRNHRPQEPPSWDGSQPLRFMSDPKTYQWHDKVMGDLKTGPEVIDDFVLIKSDGFPTYNFAHIIDDEEMKITHVIRGQEFLASVPNYLNLYEALGITPPILATMPHILGSDGGKKLSKRDGAKDVLDYLHDGYLSEALVSFIATLGWNDGTTQEVFTREELIKKFSLERVHHSGAHFDERRLLWTNGHFIRELSLDELLKLSKNYWPGSAKGSDETYKKQILGLVQERLKYLDELKQLASFFFETPQSRAVKELYAQPVDKQLKKLSQSEMLKLLRTSSGVLEKIEFSEDVLAKTLNSLLTSLSSKPGILFAILRIAVTGSPSSPPLHQTLAVLGKDTCLVRLNKAQKLLAE